MSGTSPQQAAGLGPALPSHLPAPASRGNSAENNKNPVTNGAARPGDSRRSPRGDAATRTRCPARPARMKKEIKTGREGRRGGKKGFFTSLCRPLKTTAKAPCPIRSFLLNSNFPTVSMALLRRGVPGAGGETAAGTASELQRDEEEDGGDEGAALKEN